jgi:FAD/FMN-containing dehydrogenase
MKRRSLLAAAGAIPLLPLFRTSVRAAAKSRVRPADPSWPRPESWEKLNRDVGGQLIKVRSPLAACADAPQSPACADLFRALKNPYFIGDEAGLTQTLGWADAWTSRPSAYAVAARRSGDVAAAVNFARENNLRLVVKGGGHSYQGTSNAPDSLLIWTRPMNAITSHDAFVGIGCDGRVAPQPAVSLGAGVIWAHAYDAVTTGTGRYVQGGGCATVGVAGLIQSGGFGSFSKRYGMAAAGLIEAEIVTADGAVRIANACTNPDLFWGLKGGGGGGLGVVTRLTLRTHELPAFFGAAFMTVRAASDTAYRSLIDRIIRFYGEALFNPGWGEQIVFRPDNTIAIRMVFQGLDQQQAQAVWRPFLDWIAAAPGDFRIDSAPWIAAVPARRFWDPLFMRTLPGIVLADDRPGASERNVFWAGDVGETGQFLHAYQSAWLPAALLQPEWQQRLADALFAATRHWSISLHFNKGLAGAPADAVAAARDTATNPAVLDAFALAICAAAQQPAYPGIAGREPDLPAARRRAAAVEAAMGELRKLMPAPASYVSEGDFFDTTWQQSYWGANYARLLAVKDKYDPDGLFFVHHGVGSERWSADGFTRVG